ncbi:MAG TPA: ABC transporter ATP-binding protein [Steroidobacteraceae bacterium]|nr:ABC transporter ATP-binding protein [Steroidobacteraceae bacterium]
MLSLRAVCRSFREGERLHRVLDRAEADIRDGEFVVIAGRSGSGKSTLLNLISGIDSPDSGTIQFDEAAISQLVEPERTRFRRRNIGFVYQFFNLIPTLNVEENVRLVLELDGVRGARARRHAQELLEQVGLASRSASSVDVLSGGEQQRVAIARALAHQPRLLLADEPSGNLDEENARQVQDLLCGLVRSRGSTLILATHAEVPRRLADRVLELKDGQLHEIPA